MIEALPETGPGVSTGPLDSCAGVAGLTRSELVVVLRERQAAVVAAEAALAVAVAAVGDDGMDPDDEWEPDDPREERFRSGPDGMPGFSEFAGAELGPILKVSPGSAEWEIRAMLVLRHRHPRLWEAIQAGVVRVWQAKRLIGLTGMAALTLTQARWVDGQLATVVGRVTFGRLLHLTEGLIVAADTAAAEERRLAAARSRYVRLAQTGDGLALLEVRGSAHDLILFNTMADHLADLLAIDGDPDPKPVRRATAVGILSNPAQAVLLLQRHHGTTHPATDDQHTQDAQHARQCSDDAAPGDQPAGGPLMDLGTDGGDGLPHPNERQHDQHDQSSHSNQSSHLDQWSRRRTDDRPDPDEPDHDDADHDDGHEDDAPDDAEAVASRDHSTALDMPIAPDWSLQPDPERALEPELGPDDRGPADTPWPRGPRPHWDPDDPGPPDPHPDRGPAPPFTDTSKIIITTGPDRLRPRAVLYVHVSAETLRDHNGAARVEQIGAVTAAQARDWLTGAHVRVLPVLDLASGASVDAYEVTGRLREQVVVRDVFDVFPFGQQPARGCDSTTQPRSGWCGRPTRAT